MAPSYSLAVPKTMFYLIHPFTHTDNGGRHARQQPTQQERFRVQGWNQQLLLGTHSHHQDMPPPLPSHHYNME